MPLNVEHLKSSSNTWDRVIYSAMKLGRAKSKTFIAKLCDAKRLVTTENNELDDTCNALYKERLLAMIDAYNSKYDNDWDIILDRKNTGRYVPHFIHRYTDLTIINKDGLSHDMKDLYVRTGCFFTSDGRMMTQTIRGNRLTLFSKEIDAGYRHSHLPSMDRPSEDQVDYNVFSIGSTFCIGDSSDLPTVMADMDIEFEPEKFELYLYTIDAMVAYESLEGGPHIYMNSMAARRRSVYNQSVENGMSYIQAAIADYGVSIDVDYYVSNNRYRIKKNTKFVNFIRTLFRNYTSTSIWKAFLVQYNAGTNSWYPIGESVEGTGFYRVSSELARKYFYYCGEEIRFKVKNETREQDAPNPEEFTIHPKLIDYVISQFESQLYRKAVRLSRVAKQNTISSI